MTVTKRSSALAGAAFLMATSAIGPGFLTQTTVFTQSLLASFGFVILISIVLDIGAQLNIWRMLTQTEMHAQVLANHVLPGLGYFLAFLILAGGLVFNIANMGGCGLGMSVVTGFSNEVGAGISCIVALTLFWIKEFGKALDVFTKWLGITMIVLTLYVAIASQPPLVEAVFRTFIPEKIDALAIVTLVGGTVGGYISFAGAHRLLAAGMKGKENLPAVSKSAVSGIIITGVMRIILFLAVLGVVSSGAMLTSTNPAASVFQHAAGTIGFKFFGVVMWCAAITSVVGCAYTSVSFLQGLHPFFDRHQRGMISFFIILSCGFFLYLGNPVRLLVSAGAINGLILPIALAVVLIAATSQTLKRNYQHPRWLMLFGWLVVIAMSSMSVMALLKWLS